MAIRFAPNRTSDEMTVQGRNSQLASIQTNRIHARTVVVTGASTGIGKGLCQLLTSKGYFVFGSVRKERDGMDLRRELGEQFSPLLFDVTNQQQVHDASQKVREALGGQTLFGLVNNAGVANGGPALHQDLADFRQNFDVKPVWSFHRDTGKPPTLAFLAFLPLLGTDRELYGSPGRIVQISSTAGKIGVTFTSGYVASKHALEGFSHSLRRELMLYGIDDYILGNLAGPGEVRTSIWDKAEHQAGLTLEKYGHYRLQGAAGKVHGLHAQGRDEAGDPPERDCQLGYSHETRNFTERAGGLGSVVLKALTARRPCTRYAVVRKRFSMWTLPLSLPDRWIDHILAKKFSLLPPLPRLHLGGQQYKKHM
eukprot:jgi/Botrbrau1/15143/Bobra.0149s0013.1